MLFLDAVKWEKMSLNKGKSKNNEAIYSILKLCYCTETEYSVFLCYGWQGWKWLALLIA